jgi:diguanylate cyclase (GGDEF)-like protein
MNRQAAGFLRLVSDTPGAFAPDDAQAVDLVGTLAAMSLENIQFFEQVHQQATHDALTQLHSHKAFQTRLAEELLRAGRSQTPLSLIMCDVDHFKKYNDGFGHQAGDHLLRTLAQILSSFARPVDFVARYGGEEFAIILPNFVRSEAVQLADRIRQRVASEPFVFQGKNTNATMSFGVASFPQDATTASQFVRSADERLYRAKHGGRNQVVG